MDYRELTQLLLNSCADWTLDEKKMVQKILSAMGVTVLQRKMWLQKFKQKLFLCTEKIIRRFGFFFFFYVLYFYWIFFFI